MKQIKTVKTIALILLVALMMPMFAHNAVKAADAVSTQDIVQYAEEINGKKISGYGGLCLRWAFKFFKDLGCKNAKIGKVCGCATEAGDYMIVSTSKDDIPVGAVVFFAGNSSQKKCSSCGQKPGHVGVYIGDNKVISMHKDGTAKITTLDYWARAGYAYRGYGFAKNVDIIDNVAPQDYIDISVSYTVADKLVEGCGVALTGTISASNGLVEAYAQIIDEYGRVVQEEHDYLGYQTSVSISPLSINQNLCFGFLADGKYTLRIVAVSETLCTEYKKDFEVYTPCTPTISLSVDPLGSIKKGKCKNVIGTVIADRDDDQIIEVYACVKNAAGQVLYQSYDNVNTKSVNLKKSNANYKAARFDRLSRGNYTLVITAKSALGGYAESITPFTIY